MSFGAVHPALPLIGTVSIPEGDLNTLESRFGLASTRSRISFSIGQDSVDP